MSKVIRQNAKPRVNARLIRKNGDIINPASISGLKLWLSADSGAYNDAGITLATNNQSVRQWNDKSSNAQNSFQSTAGNRPLFISSAINGKPVIRFDGIDDSLDLGQSLTGSTQTIFFVAKTTDTTNGSIVLTTIAINGDRYIVIAPSGNDLVTFAHYDPTLANSPTGIGTNFVLVTCIQNGTNGTAYLNGRAGTTNTGFSTDNTRTLDSIGGYPGAAFRMEGDIAEIIYYDVALSDNDRISVESYLNSKYAIY
jgi:hypothetical protein